MRIGIPLNVWLQGRWIYSDIEISQLRKQASSSSVVSVRREQAMIEEVLDVDPKRCCDTLSDAETLVNTQVHSPRPGPVQRVARREVGVAENVGTKRRKPERIWIPDLVA